MKAWRKHNISQVNTIQRLEGKLKTAKILAQYPEDFEDIEKLEAQIKSAKNFMLKTKLERRTHFQSEVAQPSKLLLGMFKRVGLPVPMITP